MEQVVANAASDNLQAAKEEAGKAIDEMPNLSDEQKDNAHQAVNDATDVAAVEKVLGDAISLNDENNPTFLDSLFNMVGNIVGGIWDVITAIPKGLLEALKSVVSSLGDYHFTLESAPAALTGAALVIWEAAVEIIHAPLSFLSNLVQWITGFTTGVLGGIWGPLGLIPHFLNGVLIIIDGVFNAAKAIIESIGVGVISIPAIITGSIAWAINLGKGLCAVLSGDSSAMEEFINNISQSLSQNPLIPLLLGDLFVAIMLIPKLAVEGIGVAAEWILGIITGILQVIPGIIPVAGIVSDLPLAIDGVVIAIHYGVSNVVNLITKLGMALIMGIPIGISTGTSLVTIVESFIKGMLGLSSDEDVASNPINDFIDDIINFIDSPISGIGEIISSIVSGIGQFISNPLGTIGDMIQGVIDLILSPFKGIIDAVGSFVDFITSPFEAAGGFIGDIIEGIGNIISNPFGAIGEMVQNVIDLIISPFKGIIDAVGSIINVVTHPVDAIFNLIGDSVGLAFKFITDPLGTITELFNNVIDTILSPFKGIIDFVGSIIYGITHPLETLANIFNDIVAKIFGGSSTETTEVVAESFNAIIDTVETAVEVATPAAKAVDDLLVHAEATVEKILSAPVELVFGENNENSVSVNELAEITSTLNELAGYADTNVVSLTDMAEAKPSQVAVTPAVSEELTATADVQPSQEAITPAVSEELTAVQLTSLLEENSPSEVDLDSLIGTESTLTVAETHIPEQQHSVEETGGYSVLNKIITQLQLNEDSYHFAAA
ncbi:phage tail protein [Citrobacter rodentium]|uniref:phage tail protein n=1 Tax=Citrobacter rodentium TaxID=67825 RepID=UPI001E443AF1